MKPMTMTAFVLAACLSCTACATTSHSLEGESGDPVADATRAYNHGNESLVAIAAVTTVIPGIAGDSEYINKVALKYGVHYLRGSNSDSVSYGATYNHTMMTLRGCDLSDAMARCRK